jgi:uncharacterized tellurite resistance protein B-like protein
MATSPWPDDFTIFHAMAFVYLSVTVSDGDVSEDELETLHKKLAEWTVESQKADVSQTVAEVMIFISENEGGEDWVAARFEEAVAFLKANTNPQQRRALLQDVAHIAAADGTVSPNEARMFKVIQTQLRD